MGTEGLALQKINKENSFVLQIGDFYFKSYVLDQRQSSK